MGAFCSLVDNVKNAEILGHPIVLLNKIDWEHQAPTPEVEATEVERFVTSVLNEDGGGDGSRRTGVGLLPRQAEAGWHIQTHHVPPGGGKGRTLETALRLAGNHLTAGFGPSTFTCCTNHSPTCPLSYS